MEILFHDIISFFFVKENIEKVRKRICMNNLRREGARKPNQSHLDALAFERSSTLESAKSRGAFLPVLKEMVLPSMFLPSIKIQGPLKSAEVMSGNCKNYC